MGIKSLSKFLKETFPECFETIHISQYHFKKIAIDTTLYLCNYKALYGEEGWLSAFIKLVSCLRENEIHCVFIYDSGYPPEKEAEKKERMEARKKLEKKVSDLETAIENYHATNEIDHLLIEFQNKKKINQGDSLIRKNKLNINAIEFIVRKMRKQLFQINAQDFITTKKLFDILQVPYYNSPMEAETMCADLCLQGKVDAVLSEDTDVLAYGAKEFLTKINTADGTCIRIKHGELLEKVGLNSEEFLDFCIMCGTDYNKNIFRIGPGKALKMIQTHRNIDTIDQKTILDTSILNYKRVRQLFRDYKKSDVFVPYCGTPNFDVLSRFLFEKNLKIDIHTLEKSFLHNNIIIFEDEKEQPKQEKCLQNEITDEIIITENDTNEEDEIILVE